MVQSLDIIKAELSNIKSNHPEFYYNLTGYGMSSGNGPFTQGAFVSSCNELGPLDSVETGMVLIMHATLLEVMKLKVDNPRRVFKDKIESACTVALTAANDPQGFDQMKQMVQFFDNANKQQHN